MRISNPDVPPEAVIRQLQKQVNKLKLEKAIIKNNLDCKEQAIAAFKKWQAQVAERKWQYWLGQGIELMETPPDTMLLNKVRSIISTNVCLQEWERKVERVLASCEKARSNFRKYLYEQELKKELNNEDSKS